MSTDQDDVKADFIRAVADHEMTVIRDHGLDRHLRFRKPGTVIHGFDLITWPGHLCITGDNGSFLFARIEDMFQFFADPPWGRLHINPGYWGEKVLAEEKHGGIREYDGDALIARVWEDFQEWCDDCDESNYVQDTIRDLIEEQVVSRAHDSEHEGCNAVWEFRHPKFEFTDFFDGFNATRYTYQYLWCLYAIVWGIGEYRSIVDGMNVDQKKRQLAKLARELGVELPESAVLATD